MHEANDKYEVDGVLKKIIINSVQVSSSTDDACEGMIIILVVTNLKELTIMYDDKYDDDGDYEGKLEFDIYRMYCSNNSTWHQLNIGQFVISD